LIAVLNFAGDVVLAQEAVSRISIVKRSSLKLLIAAVIGLDVALSMTAIPLLPFNQAIFLAGALGITFALIAVKKPRAIAALASFAMLCLSIYHLNYLGFLGSLCEFGLAFKTLAIVWCLGLLLSIAFILDTPQKALSAFIGLLAFFLMFTNLYYLAIPLIIVSVLIFSGFNPWISLFYYLVLYIPFQVVSFSIEKLQGLLSENFMDLPPLLYTKLTIYEAVPPPLSTLTIEDLINALTTHAEEVSVQALSNSMIVYANSAIALSGFVLFIVASLTVARLTLKSTKIFASLKSIYKYAETVAKAAAMIASILIFHVLTTTLASSLNYITYLTDVTLIYSVFFAIAAGFSVLFSNLMLSVLESQERFREELKSLLSSMEKECERLLGILSDVKNLLPISDVSPIERRLALLLDKSRTSKSKLGLAGFLKLKSISQTAQSVKTELEDVKSMLNNALSSMYLRRASDLKDVVDWAKSIGVEISLPEGVDLSVSNEDVFKSWDEERKVEALRNVNKAAEDVARSLLNLYEQIYNTIRGLVDPALPPSSAGYNVIKAYLDQGDSWLALREVKERLNEFEAQYAGKLKDLKSRVVELVRNFETKFLNELMTPFISAFGKEAFKDELESVETIKSLGAVLEKVDEIPELVKMNVTLSDLYAKSMELLKKIYDKVLQAEKAVDEKSPIPGYDWGKDVEFYTKVREVLTEELYNPLNPQSMLNACEYILLELAPKGLTVLKRYLAMREFMANYPVAELIMSNELSRKGMVKLEDLPFSSEYAKEYMRLYFTKHFTSCSLDSRSWILKKRAAA